MELKELTSDVIIYNFILYGCLPLWLIMGFGDWWCHKKSRIEATTGVKESIYHAIMGVQIGIPVFLGFYFKINVLLLILMFIVLIFHEWVAHTDVAYALNTREISIYETHIHSFLEVLPFVIVALIVAINWPAFIDLITFNWAGNMGLIWQPVNIKYITAYFVPLIVLDVIPFIEELIRCYRYEKSHPKSEAGS